MLDCGGLLHLHENTSRLRQRSSLVFQPAKTRSAKTRLDVNLKAHLKAVELFMNAENSTIPSTLPCNAMNNSTVYNEMAGPSKDGSYKGSYVDL